LKTIVYQSTPAFFYLSIIIGVFILSLELRIFDREREDGLYGLFGPFFFILSSELTYIMLVTGTIPWVISISLSYLPGQIVFPSIYAIIVYFMTGFWRENLAINLLQFMAQCIMQQIAAWGYALLACSLARGFAGASLLANGFSIPFILSSGYLIINLPVWVAWTRWISPYFYGFNWIARTQFQGRTFACVGIEGAARNACDGTAVLVGFQFALSTPLYVYPLGLLGFIIVTNLLSIIVLDSYHPGGVQHGEQQDSVNDIPALRVGLEKNQVISRGSQVTILVDRLNLAVSTRAFFKPREPITKVILEGISCAFPANQVSVVMGPSGAGKSSFLSLIAGRLNSGSLSDFTQTGDVLVNGQLADESTAALISFVEQVGFFIALRILLLR
jgi:ABC-type multidrug transport system fused ATPase/permease subunit